MFYLEKNHKKEQEKMKNLEKQMISQKNQKMKWKKTKVNKDLQGK